jgi:3-oxoacyl-[acyl-carrier protein] reductase
MHKLLENKTAIVTGGTAGIGKAIALKFAQHGAKIAIFGTNAERGKQAMEEIQRISQGQPILFSQVDVANHSAVENEVKKVLDAYGHVDILVNNAGITRDQLLMKMSEEEWDAVLNTNLKSCYNLCRTLVRVMLKARQGKIINMTSVVGIMGNAGQTNYAASKAGIIGFTKALAKELASRNICVNGIAPGFIETQMTAALTDKQKEAILAEIPMGRLGNVEDVAHAALFLASPHSDYMTGQILTVDGGMAM